VAKFNNNLTKVRIAAARGQHSCTLQWATFHLKIDHPTGYLDPYLTNAWFLGLTRVHTPKVISIGSAVLQGSRSWQTDRAISVTIGRIYVYGSTYGTIKQETSEVKW